MIEFNAPKWVVKCAHGHRAEGGEQVIAEMQARIADLEAENAEFRVQFKDADEIAALFAQWRPGDAPPEGWTAVQP